MNKFHELKIVSVEKNTSDSILVSFDIPSKIKKTFLFYSGQYITLEKEIDNVKIRRAYSICSSPIEQLLQVGIKKVNGGLFSTYANEKFKSGDFVKVFPPEGRFIFNKTSNPSIIAIAAGSGITPVISIIKMALNKNKKNKIHLLYGNKSPKKTMFYDLLKSLELKHENRFKISWYFSEIKRKNAYKGRIDKTAIMNLNPNLHSNNLYYICGPGKMTALLSKILINNTINKNQIYTELFINNNSKIIESNKKSGILKIIYDNTTHKINFKPSEILLDTILNNNIDVPHSCQGGVCSTCISRIKEGQIKMKTNQILTDDEIKEGLILTCQAIPKSKKITIDFDDV